MFRLRSGFTRIGSQREGGGSRPGMLPPVCISDEDVEHSASDKSTGLLDRGSRHLAGCRQRPIQPLSRNNEVQALSAWLIMSAADVIPDPMANPF